MSAFNAPLIPGSPPSEQSEIVAQPVRDVTLSIWKVMFHLRKAWLTPASINMRSPSSVSALEPFIGTGTTGGTVPQTGIRSPHWEDPDALEYWVRAWTAGGPSGPAGDTLHRFLRWVLRCRVLRGCANRRMMQNTISFGVAFSAIMFVVHFLRASEV